MALCYSPVWSEEPESLQLNHAGSLCTGQCTTPGTHGSSDSPTHVARLAFQWMKEIAQMGRNLPEDRLQLGGLRLDPLLNSKAILCVLCTAQGCGSSWWLKRMEIPSNLRSLRKCNHVTHSLLCLSVFVIMILRSIHVVACISTSVPFYKGVILHCILY